MSEHAIDAQPFPRPMLLGAGALIVVTLLGTAAASIANIGATRLDTSDVRSTRDVRFVEMAGGMVRATDATTGMTIADIASAGNGFVGVVIKGFSRDRALAGTAPNTAYRLKTLSDGRTLIEDPTSGRIVMLGAFGSDNLKAFTQLMANGR
jgi:putative photosynthetic complex assembly protein